MSLWGRPLVSTGEEGSGVQRQAVHSWEAYYAPELTWYRHLRNVLHHRAMFDAIARLRPARLLEVGAGTGSHSIYLSYRYPSVVAVDVSAQLVERCVAHRRRLHGGTQFAAMDAFRLAFGDCSFDVAFSQGFFEHFSDDEIGVLLAEQARVARYVAFSVPNRRYAVRDFGDERLLDRLAWEALLAGLGYRIIESRDYAPARLRFWRGGRDMYLAVVERAG